MLREQLIAEISAAVRIVLRTESDVSDDAASAATSLLTPLIVFAPNDPSLGDFATDVARQIARLRRDRSLARPLAETIAHHLTDAPGGLIESAHVGGGDEGIVSLHLRDEALGGVIETILAQGEQYGHAGFLAGRRILLEFVSAHPNAPLNLLHGRGGAVGDALGALFTACGAQVQREYYVNDADDSRPLRALARAVLAQVRRQAGFSDKTDPDGDGYPEGYVQYLAETVGDTLESTVGNGLVNDAATLKRVQRVLLDTVLAHQKNVLDRFGVRFDNWFAENTLLEQGETEAVIQDLLQSKQASRHADGSVWLQAARFGDEADRALLRSDGTATYLAGDLAYHRHKFARGFDRLVDVWGAEHEMYIPRTRAGIAALGLDPASLDVVVCQPVRLLQDGTEVRSSARYGGAPLLEEAIEQVGTDALRFALLLSAPQTPLDIDLDALRSERSPLARVRAAARAGQHKSHASGTESAARAREARALIARLSEFPGVVARSVEDLAPYRLPLYARDIADAFLALAPSAVAGEALAQAVSITLENALALIGVTGALPAGGVGAVFVS